MTPETGRHPTGFSLWFLLWSAGLYLRLTLLVAPPLGPYIARELDLSVAGMGALTTLPVLLLALGAIMGAWVVARLGPGRTVAACLVVIVLGSATRAGAGQVSALFAATAVMGLGISALQPALPALVRLWSPTRVAVATAVYMNGMLMGEVLAAGLTLPVILPLTGDSWRLSLLVWSLPGLLVALAVGWNSRGGNACAGSRRAAPWKPDFRDPVVWQLGAVLGCSASVFFGINAYMAPILEGRSEGDNLAAGLFVFNSAQIAASLLTLKFAAHWLGRFRPMVLCTLVSLVGTFLFGWTSGWPAIASAFSVSLAAGVLLVLMVSMPGALTPARNTASLAAGMFTVGYALTFILPQIGGMLVDNTGYEPLALAPLLVIAAVAVPTTGYLARAYRRRAL